MTRYYYTGRITNFSRQYFPTAHPRAWIEPEHAAMGPQSALMDRRILLTLDESGEFGVYLTASDDCTPHTKYRLRCEWVASTGQVFGASELVFTAVIGGGNIHEMPISFDGLVWYSTEPPPFERGNVTWINPVTGDVREWV